MRQSSSVDEADEPLSRAAVIDLTEDNEVWPNFNDLDDMDLWKGIAMSLGKGATPLTLSLTSLEPTFENCRELKMQSQSQIGDPVEQSDLPDSKSAQRGLQRVTVSDSDTASEEDGEVVPPKPKVKPAPTKPEGLAGLDRAAMERERLERARKAGFRQTSPEPPLKRQKINHDNEVVSSTFKSAGKGIQYLNGTIKWTYAEGYPRESHTITIEEVLQKETLKAAVLSAFQVRCSLVH
jgi:hypothetical protein